jgi:hypothetical protein
MVGIGTTATPIEAMDVQPPTDTKTEKVALEFKVVVIIAVLAVIGTVPDHV